MAVVDGRILVGGGRFDGSPGSGVVWSSTDGTTWQDAFVHPSNTTWVVSSGSQAIVAMDDGIWRSEDGVAWTPATTHLGKGQHPVAIPGGGFLVFVPATFSCRIWTSPNGDVWTAQPATALKGRCPEDIAAGPDGIVAVGTNGPGPWIARSTTGGATWQTVLQRSDGGVLADVDASNGGFIAAVSSGDFGHPERRGSIWMSGNGRTWTRTGRFTTRPGFDKSFIDTVTRFGPGYVATGSSISGKQVFHADVLVSATGASWSRPSISFGANVQNMSGAIVWHDHLIVIGTQSASVASSDGVALVWTAVLDP